MDIGMAFSEGLFRILRDKLHALYVYGAAAFQENAPIGDIDFHVILEDPLTDHDRTHLYEMHDTLARDFPLLGSEMDGY